MKYLKNIFFLLVSYATLIHPTLALSTIVGDSFTEKQFREGSFSIDDIPTMIKGAINFAMGVAGTIAIIFIIIGAYNIMLGDIATEKSKGKEIIMKAIGGFALAALAWVIIKLIVDNLG